MNSRYCLTFKSTFQPEKPKKLENYFFYVKIFDWDYLHLTAQTKETYFSKILRNFKNSNLRAGLGINGGAILSRGAPFFPINCTFGDGYGLAFVLKYERAPGTDQREVKINKN